MAVRSGYNREWEEVRTMMDWNSGVDAGWVVVMCLVMLLAAAMVSAAVYLGLRGSGRERR